MATPTENISELASALRLKRGRVLNDLGDPKRDLIDLWIDKRNAWRRKS